MTVKQGSEPDWDNAMRERLTAAREQPGWIGGQIVIPLGALNERLIIGTWRTRADWEAWHRDPAFTATRTRLDGLAAGAAQETWHEVIEDVRLAA